MHKVFVYGTLLSGQYNNYRLQNNGSILLGDVIIDIPLEMHDMGPFPALVESVDNNTIIGEVWEISDLTLQSLDFLEGYPNFYNRKLIQTDFGDAWVYFCNDAEKEPVIDSGNWLSHIKGE